MGRNLLNEIAGYAPGGLQPAVEPAVRPADSKLHLQQMLSLQLRPILWDNLILVIIVVVYIAAIYGVHTACGIRDRIVLLFFSESFTRMAIIFTGLFFLYHIWKKSYRQLITPRSLIGFLTVFALMPVFKSAFASYKQTIPLVNPFSWDYSLMRLDHFLHFGNHPWRLLEPIVQSPLLMRAADYVYMSWFYLLFLSCLWMGWTPRRHLRLCYLVSTLLVWVIIGSVFATFLSSAGPCFYSKIVSAEEDPYAPQMKNCPKSVTPHRVNTCMPHSIRPDCGKEKRPACGDPLAAYRPCRAFIWQWQHYLPGSPFQCANGSAGFSSATWS
ncbi:MAG: phosphatase PAP2 family protein [Acidobacteriota bacterium]|nr:phosphatase PAP2 family protein [Acidobacteriota bacterium]